MFRYLYFFLAFLSIVYALGLVFDLRHYARLNGTTLAKEAHFSVSSENEKYRFIAHYKVGLKEFSSTYDPPFLNEWAAEEAGKKWLHNPKVYVDADDVSYSALQKTFPIKQLAYTLILVGLTGYFFILDRRFKNGGSTKKPRSSSDV
ncbi:MAG: hypothetical protein ACK4HV_02740 [Parachlamydiaceae bacterium]